jgi:cobalamin biosynthesis protein CbiG
VHPELSNSIDVPLKEVLAENKAFQKLGKLKARLDSLCTKYGIPFIESVTASTIYDLLKAFLVSHRILIPGIESITTINSDRMEVGFFEYKENSEDQNLKY